MGECAQTEAVVVDAAHGAARSLNGGNGGLRGLGHLEPQWQRELILALQCTMTNTSEQECTETFKETEYGKDKQKGGSYIRFQEASPHRARSLLNHCPSKISL